MGEENDMKKFQKALAVAKNVVVLTGAGVSAESGVPTFRGAGGFWRKFDATKLATPTAFKQNPSRTWVFYHYRRDIVSKVHTNPAHRAIAALEQSICTSSDPTPRSFTLVTQNIDGLHLDAGSQNVIEMHGSLWKTRCTACGDVQVNKTNPIVPALEGTGANDVNAEDEVIATENLPRCQQPSCGGLLRPHVIWFGEELGAKEIRNIQLVLAKCDLLIVAGTSGTVWPAAGYAHIVKSRGGLVAEFNLEQGVEDAYCDFFIEGKAGTTLPEAFGVEV
ncbi:NAD-dependent protein deacylase sirtuin-5, mitochondrial [Rhizophlyctis rosea]|nr:NAD-dependent protein deacylase sirtuin-5, mitochondrial [Rhizophlyctis rosea]